VLFHAAGVQAQQAGYDVTADGKKFLINSSDAKEESQALTLVQNWKCVPNASSAAAGRCILFGM